MGSSRTLAAAGLRTAPRAGWRSALLSAAGVVVAEPALWLLGALGFSVRGGLLLLALPIIVVPTPVEVRALIGEGLSSSGLTAAFYAQLVPLGVLAAIVLLGALLVAAFVELTSFERLMRDPETFDHRHGRDAAVLSGGQRRSLLGGLFSIQLLALAALAAAAVPLAVTVGEVALIEIMRPTPGGGALYLRVLHGVREPLLLMLPALVVVELFSAMASRRLLVRRFGLDAAAPPRARQGLASLASALVAPLHHPLRAVGTSLLAWASALLVLIPVGWAISVAASATRDAYLAPRAGTAEQLPWLVVVTLVFTAVWLTGILLAGFASALRAGLWSAESLH